MNERTARDLLPDDVPDDPTGPDPIDAFEDDVAGDEHDGAGSDAALDDPERTDSPDDPDDGVAHRRSVERWVSWAIVAACAIFVFWSLHPQLIFRNTTPTGGDMGAHVWGPQFLMDHLLTDGRVTGWTQDWYAGFPAYVFYMVVPSLFIVWLSAALSGSFTPLLLIALGVLATWARSKVDEQAARRLHLASLALAALAVVALVTVFAGAEPPTWVSAVLLVALAGALLWASTLVSHRWARPLLWASAIFVVVLAAPIPYNVAFKLVAVSGLVTLPIAAYALARAARVPFPGPPMIALATLPFIYDKGFTILGGNGASTMAGEFAFSISLTFAVLFLAVAFRGMRTGRARALGAVLLALTILCHLIPAIFAGIATFVLLLVRREDRTPWWDRDRTGRIVAAVLAGVVLLTLVPDFELPVTDILNVLPWVELTSTNPVFGSPVPQWLFPAFGTVVALVLLTGFEPKLVKWWTSGLGLATGGALLAGLAALLITRSTWWTVAIIATTLGIAFFSGWDDRLARWLVLAAPVGIAVTGFWSIPFLTSSTYMNDMGWEKYTRYSEHLLGSPISDMSLPGMPYRNIVYALAGLGIVLSLIHRVRFGWFLTLLVVTFSWIFRFFPQYRLWNARLLPFLYLGLYLLAGLALALALRSLTIAAAEFRRSRVEPVAISVAGVSVAALLIGIVLLASFRVLPGGRPTTAADDSGRALYHWAGIDFETGIVPDWARWNFEGLERKGPVVDGAGNTTYLASDELRGIVDMMEGVADDHGCGRAMWEYEPDLQRFGTPMALMLLPYFTNSCIGSMEGLYFEASSTTPFHFLNQSALSEQPSRAQRDLPYTPFDIDLGVQQLQMLGVRYYMATSEVAITAAREHEDLTEVAAESFEAAPAADTPTQHDWVVFEVADSDLVTGLANDPVVLTDADDHIDGWVYAAGHEPAPEGQPRVPKTAGPAVTWFQDPARWDTLLATSGPSDWPRAPSTDSDPPRQENPPVEVTNVTTTNDTISFEVDRTGVPVLVRTSYFPNWTVDGADEVHRVSPNFMVVVPTDEQVTLSYGRSSFELIGILLTLAGLAGIVGLGALDVRAGRRITEEGTDESAGESADERSDEDPDEQPVETLEPLSEGPVPTEA